MSEENTITETNCSDRRKPIEDKILAVENKINSLSKKIDWFYILAIATLIGVIVDIVKGKL